jgi:hypothetical protein
MIELTACPECGQPAEVLWREVLTSTDGPVEHARVLCISRHGFFVPVETLPAVPPPPAAPVAPVADAWSPARREWPSDRS